MQINKTLVVVFLILAVVGFIDATYLTVEYYMGVIPPCAIVDGCSTVLTSTWSKIAGIPVALLGSIYYLFIALLCLIFLRSKQERFLQTAAYCSALGLAAALWFVSLQLFVIKEICFYCMISAITSTALFGVGAAILALGRSQNNVINKITEEDVARR